MLNRVTWFAAAVTMLLASLALAACGSGGSSAGGSTTGGGSSESKQQAPNIALLLYTHTDYQAAYEKGLNAKLKPLGGSFTQFISNFNPTEEASQCQGAITSGRYDAIVLEPISGPTAVPCANEAKAAGIPLISIERGVGPEEQSLEPTVPGVVGQVVIVESESIEHQLEEVKQACRGLSPCQLIAEIASPTDNATVKPIKAIEKELPNVEVVGKFATNYDSSQVAKDISEQLTAHPGANVYFSIADSSATAALPVIREAGLAKKLAVIGYGGSVEGVEAIKKGEVQATLALFPQTMGETAAEMAIEAVNGEPIAEPGVNAGKLGTPPVVTAANVDQFTPQWGAGIGG